MLTAFEPFSLHFGPTGDEHFLPFELFVVHFDCVFINEGAGAENVVNAHAGDGILIDTVEPLHIVVPVGFQLFKVECVVLDLDPAAIGHEVDLLNEVGHIKHDFLGYTAYVDAGAPYNSVFYE